MSDQNSNSQFDPEAAPAPAPNESVALGRRRLIKIGASSIPVVMTLASKPVLAWHCKSPSAWGSEQLNPNTSLSHNEYQDETWTITNWKGNTARSAVGTSMKPWDKLKSVYPSIYDSSTKTNNAFDYTKVKVSKLFSVVSTLGRPSGLSDSTTIKTVLTSGTTFQKNIICAQLNYLLLSPLSLNQMESCIDFSELKKMAAGSYSPPTLPGVTWNSTQIVTYLQNNYFTAD